MTTTYFGSVPYQPESVVEFPLGLPGFENEHRFVLIEQELNKPVVFLQSLARPDLCFITLPVGLISGSYELSLSGEDLGVLGLADQPGLGADPAVVSLAVVTFTENQPPTANLLSPIVINWRSRLGVQILPADSPHSHRHPLFAESREAPCL
ncbi:MAG TPA: flagellar assembly protein FliW [Bryobacteraceae bacterium]|nr:flagellar assembly protein FliW [Bryobacteraceae bacterium]